jgi:hypothetical protein
MVMYITYQSHMTSSVYSYVYLQSTEMGYSQHLHTEFMLLTFVDGAFERKQISGFLSANKLPLVVTFSMKQHQLFLRMKSADK